MAQYASTQYPVEVVSLNALPEHLNNRGFGGKKGSGKWEWVRKLLVEVMGPEVKRNSFSAMLANQSIRRLDTFGISSGKVRERIAELQK